METIVSEACRKAGGVVSIALWPLSHIPCSPALQSAEIFTLTYGSMVRQLIADYEDVEEVNKQLDKMCAARRRRGAAAWAAA